MTNDDTVDSKANEGKGSDPRASIAFDAPLIGNVSVGSSWERRRQTMAMFTCSLYFIMPMVLFCWTMVVILMTASRWTAAPVACYISYAFLIDKAPLTGHRRPWLRYFRTWWNHACDYLPILLVKTADLDPTKKYVLGYHPHGIISVGCFCAFATDGARTLSLVKEQPTKQAVTVASSKENKSNTATKKKNDAAAITEESCNTIKSNDDNRGFSTLFPGIDRRVITLPQNFTTPFLREYFLSLGGLNSAKETFRSVLARDGTALVVVVGGAAESMLVRNNRSIDLVLESRKGFVREAIRANACLVPVIGFGESDLYKVYHPEEDENGNIHWIGRLQDSVKRATGIAMPLFQGRSIFLKDVGVMPQRTPVCVVVGAPIEPPPASYWKVKGNDQPSRSTTSFAPLVDRKADKPLNKDGEILYEWHAKYMQALKELHHTHEDAKWNVPGQKRRSSLTIVR